MSAMWLIIALHFLIFFSKIDPGQGKLLLLQVFFRHGDRAPHLLYPNDPNPPEFWEEGFGKLTKLGRIQHYTLGKQLRSMYSDFITSNPNEVLVYSTAVDRCLRSAEAHLAGLYAPVGEWKFDPDLDWQPIPVFYEPLDKDKYLNPHYPCPRASAENLRIYSIPEFQRYYQMNEPMLKNLAYNSGANFKVMQPFKLQNTLSIEKKYNLTIPSWVYPYYDQLQEYAFNTHFMTYASPVIQRIRAGPLLGKIVQNMNSKVAGDIPNLKVQIYSARDRNLVAMMQALKVFNMQVVPYCATLLFELHELDEAQNAVRLLYMNSTRPEDGNQVPHVLVLKDCEEYCPLEYFINYTKPVIPTNWEKECGMDT